MSNIAKPGEKLRVSATKALGSRAPAAAASSLRRSAPTPASASQDPVSRALGEVRDTKVINLTFEIFGRVQGVFFRKHTEQRARELGLVGWVENTDRGSVRGQAQGREADVAAMKQWLTETGSPKSRIDRAEFSDEREIPEPAFFGFSVRR